jgi:transposase
MRELSVAEQRYQAVMAVIGDGLSISQVAEKVGVSRQTLHAWLARLPVLVIRVSRNFIARRSKVGM